MYGLLGVLVCCVANFGLAYWLNVARNHWRRGRYDDRFIDDARMLNAQLFIKGVRDKHVEA